MGWLIDRLEKYETEESIIQAIAEDYEGDEDGDDKDLCQEGGT